MSYEPYHAMTYWQARCTNCGTICDDYGDYSEFSDPSNAVQYVTEFDDWFARYKRTPAPTAENQKAVIIDLVELLCPNCQKCEVCDSGTAYSIDDEHMVCEEHENHDFTEESA